MATREIIFRIPLYLVQSVGDHGTSEEVMPDGSTDSDDLRVTLELSGGHLFFLESGQGMLIEGTDLCICRYVLDL